MYHRIYFITHRITPYYKIKKQIYMESMMTSHQMLFLTRQNTYRIYNYYKIKQQMYVF